MNRFLCLLLSLVLLFSLSACAEIEPTVTTTTADEGETNVATSGFVPKNAYTLVWGELYGESEDNLGALRYLLGAMESCYELKCTSKNDYYIPAGGLKPAKYEILIGDTNRPQSQAALSELGINDYTYRVESEGVIVICGGSPEATERAVRKFCEDVLGYRNGIATEKKKPIEVGASYTYRDTYACTSATLNGVDLSEWRIALYNKKGMDAACAIAQTLGSYTGERISVIDGKKLTGTEKNVIFVGNQADTSDYTGYTDLSVSVESGNTQIVLDSNVKEGYLDLQKDFLKLVRSERNGSAVALAVETYENSEFLNETFHSLWELKSEDKRVLADGLLYLALGYRDFKNLPYRLYALVIDPTIYDICMGASKDGYDKAVAVADRQNVEEHMRAAVANGKNVIAGVNADFFNMQSDYSPCGLAIKDGMLIGEAHGRPFFGMTEDGVAVIGEAAEYSETLALENAVGGSAIILKNGIPTREATVEDVHPRTLVGIRKDGKVVLAVIDGRQPEISNGADLFRCARLMESLGCVTALNLDGGGSSTFVTREGDAYTTCNSPSDGSLRKVYNSLLVVKK